jgi:purine-binding chemotaxis protein CheW
MNTAVLPAPSAPLAAVRGLSDAAPQPAACAAQQGLLAHLPGTVLSLRLANQAFAIDIGCVREIRSFERPTPLPGAAPGLLGVINLRGAIVSVIDLRCRLGLAPRAEGPGGAVVVVERPCRLDGVVVDAVEDVLELAPSLWRAVPPLGDAAPQGQVRALASIDERLIQLLDIAVLLRDPAPVPPPAAR